MLVGFDLDAGVGNHAARGARKLEQSLGRKQLFLGLFKKRLLARRFGGVLEADDIGAGGLEFHADARPLDGNIERAASVLVGAELAMLRRSDVRWAADAEPQGEENDVAHRFCFPNSEPDPLPRARPGVCCARRWPPRPEPRR